MEPTDFQRKAMVTSVNNDWSAIEGRYVRWNKQVYEDTISKTPTVQQARILQMVHHRTQYEFFLEQGLSLPPHLEHCSQTPLYRLIHGLPGAGKSQVLLWLREYFEEVWLYTYLIPSVIFNF